MTDGLSTLYQDLLGGSYDCVDRIVLNAYFRMGHDPGGFRVWWRALTGSDETLENAYLMRLAGRFSRRIRGYAKAHDIPVIDCPAGQRKHDACGRISGPDQGHPGLFLVLVGRAQAPVWDVGAKHHIERKKPMPYVNHYSFHILDPDWGHLTIKISGHPPFPAQVILNGHEYVACQARKAGITFTKEGNCFTTISDAAGLAKIADTLSEPRAIGRLSQVCERWIYDLCMLRARLRRAEAQRVPLPVLQLSDRIQSKPGLRGGRAHGPGVSGPHRPQPCPTRSEDHQDHPRIQASSEKSPANQAVGPNGKSRSRDLRMI